MALDGNHSIGSGGHVDDHNLIDAALASQTKIVSGTYVGDGTSGRKISLVFKPKIVFASIVTGNQPGYIGFDVGASWNVANANATFTPPRITMQSDGFVLTDSTINGNGATYQYLAIG